MPVPTTGLIGRYIAGTGITQSGGLVSAWADQSGGGNNLSATVGQQPISTTDWIGAPIVRFPRVDTTNGNCRMTSSAPAINARACSIFVIGRTATGVSEAFVGVNGYAGGSANFRQFSSTTVAQRLQSVGVASSLRVPNNKWLFGTANGAASTVFYTHRTSSSGAAVTAGTGTGGIEVGAFSSASYACLDVYEILVYSAQLSGTDITDIQNYAISTYGLTSTYTRLIALEGDSITNGVGSDNNQSYPFQTTQTSNNNSTWEFYNIASSGATITTITGRATATDGLIRAGYRNLLMVLIGRNDAVTTAGATIYANLVTYCQARVAAGWEVWVGTCIATGNATIQGRLDVLNGLIRSSIITDAGVTRVVDFAANPVFAPGASGNLTYYNSDQTHPTNAGYAVMASILSPFIEIPSNIGGFFFA